MTAAFALEDKIADNRKWILNKIRQNKPVACGSCTACCRSMSPMLYPELGDNPQNYQTTTVFDSYWGGPRHMLARRADGACRYLSDETGCTIHATRPRVCRSYSCVEQYSFFTRKERRELKRTGKWTAVHSAGEKRYTEAKQAREGEQDATPPRSPAEESLVGRGP